MHIRRDPGERGVNVGHVDQKPSRHTSGRARRARRVRPTALGGLPIAAFGGHRESGQWKRSAEVELSSAKHI